VGAKNIIMRRENAQGDDTDKWFRGKSFRYRENFCLGRIIKQAYGAYI